MNDDPNLETLIPKLADLQAELDQLGLNVGRESLDASQVRNALGDLAVGVSDVMNNLLWRFDQVDRKLADMRGALKWFAAGANSL